MKKARPFLHAALAFCAISGCAQAQSTDLNLLTLGASMNYMYAGDADGSLSGDGRRFMVNLSDYQAAHTNYLAWKNLNMDRLIDDWINGTLSPQDQPYLRIIQADYLYRADSGRYHNVDSVHCENYFTTVKEAGEAAMKKGYRGESLTAGDWEDLRVFRLQDDVQNVGTENLPYMLHMTFSPPQGKIFDVGADVPDLRLPKLETVLARSNYTDGVRIDPAAAFYARGTNRYARLFSGYTTNGAAPYEVRALEIVIPPGETTNDYVTIGGEREKPMVLIPAQLSDGWWMEFNAHDLRPVYNAYKDVADFYFINLQYHDVSSRSWEYFGSNAGRTICVMDMETSKELAAEARNQWMTYPWFSIPTLVDVEGSIARNSFATEGGDSYYLVVDVNGKVAYDGRRYIWENYASRAEDFSGGTAWANLMERELVKVLNNDGEFIPTNVTDWTAFEVGATLAGRRTGRITGPTIDSVDMTSNTVVVSKTINNTNYTFTLEIGPDTRLSHQEQVGDLSTFSVGDTITVKFWADTYPSATYTANYDYTSIPGERNIGKRVVRYEVSGDSGDGVIRHPRQLNEGTAHWVNTAPMTWVVGTLESVSSTSREISVRLNVDTNAMHGWTYWQTAGGLATLWGDAARNMGTLSQWVEAGQSGSNWTFVIDDDVDIFINAENAAYDNLVPGNPIGLLYRIHQHGNQTAVYPEVLRLSGKSQVAFE